MRSFQIANLRLIYLLRACLGLYRPNFWIQHNFRQVNMDADRLAALAHLHQSAMVLHHENCVHNSVSHALQADKIGLWNFRS